MRRIRLCVERLLGALNEKRKKSLFGSIGTISSSHTLSVPMHLTSHPLRTCPAAILYIFQTAKSYIYPILAVCVCLKPATFRTTQYKKSKHSFSFVVVLFGWLILLSDLFMLMFVSILCWPVRWLGRESEGVGLEQTFLFLFFLFQSVLMVNSLPSDTMVLGVL